MDTQIGENAREARSPDKPQKTFRQRPRRTFTPEFKVEAVRLCKVGDRSIRQVAEELDLSETALREWVHRADIDAGKGPAGALTSEVVAEFERSRRTYGSPRIRAALRDRGIRIGRGRTARLMRERGLSARRKKAFRTVPKCCDGPRVAPNRLKRKLNPRKPGLAWVTDVK